MGCSTKGVITTTSKDVVKVLQLVEGALSTLISKERSIRFPERLQFMEAREQFSTPSFDFIPGSRMAQAVFKFNGETRTLSIFFDCDCDHLALAPKTLSMSLGASGESVLFMKAVLHALSFFGDAYFVENDCSDEEYRKLEEFRPNLLQCLALDYLTPYELTKWVQEYQEQGLAKASNRKQVALIGQSLNALDAIYDDDHKVYWEALRDMAAKQPTRNMSFLDEYHERMSCLAAA